MIKFDIEPFLKEKLSQKSFAVNPKQVLCKRKFSDLSHIFLPTFFFSIENSLCRDEFNKMTIYH